MQYGGAKIPRWREKHDFKNHDFVQSNKPTFTSLLILPLRSCAKPILLFALRIGHDDGTPEEHHGRATAVSLKDKWLTDKVDGRRKNMRKQLSTFIGHTRHFVHTTALRIQQALLPQLAHADNRHALP